jgi:hypothetical protein
LAAQQKMEFARLTVLIVGACSALLPALSRAEERFEMRAGVSRDEVLTRTLRPFDGASSSGVSRDTLLGKVMCGYQGWFTCPGDGADRGWHHWNKNGAFEPGRCKIDLWPDTSEFDADERFDTKFVLADGQPAQVFSSLHPKTIDRHFRWMREYGLDGVFVQRFGVEVRHPHGLYHFNTVLDHCRTSANRHGRAYAVMYDLSGLGAGETQIIIDDWKQLVDRMRIGRDSNDRAYLHHSGKPMVVVWGIGFDDNRRYTLEECAALVDFLQNDPKYGGNTVMVGVPTYWRTLGDDCVDDQQVHEIIRSADLVSPWSVGRYDSVEAVERIARDVWGPDIEWCRANSVEFLPVVFPGFSWHNMFPKSPLNQIPRRRGQFLWKQYAELQKLGAPMIYQAMFDEVDEGTAIFKCTNDPPVGASKFIDYEGLPSDFYLRLVGNGGKLIRGEIPPTAEPPAAP